MAEAAEADSIGWHNDSGRIGLACTRSHTGCSARPSTPTTRFRRHGCAKLVRLSRDNVQSNVEATANYLTICSDDRAIATLALHYCYGLSVLHSHLLRGAAAILTRLRSAVYGDQARALIHAAMRRV